MSTLPAFLPVLIFIVIAIVLAAGYLWHKRARLRLAISEALDADELDFDRRLGPLQFLDRSEGKIAYRQIGEGPDLLCLHGIGASMIIYRRLVPLLADRYRVTCLDLPGFGWSDKPHSLSYELEPQAEALTAAIHMLDLKKPLVVASSMGAAIALASLTHEAWARAIIALAPATDPGRIPKVLLPIAAHGERLQRLPLSTRATVRAITHKVIARREIITPGLIDAYFRPYKAESSAAAAFLKSFRLLGDRRMPTLFKTLTVPLVILYGKNDGMVRAASCEKLEATVPGAKLIVHPTAGHHIMEDEPEWTAEQIAAVDENLV